MAGETIRLRAPSVVADLPSDWTWGQLDEICEGIFDCPHSTPVLSDQGPFIARSQDMRTGVFRIEDAGRVSKDIYRERIARAEPRYGDLLYSREGTYFGIAAEVPAGVRVCLGQRMVLLRPKPSNVDFRFLRYWLNSPAMGLYTHGHRDGTVAERLNLPTIRGLPVALPPLPEQRAIASLLGALDDKIELNRQMNETLEATARLFFKDWFVDFGPTRAKAEGRARQDGARSGQPRKPLNVASDLAWPAAEAGAGAEGQPYLAPELWALFPDALDDDDKPVGWSPSPLLTHAKLISGGTPKTDVTDYWGGEIAWASAKDVSQCTDLFLVHTERSITQRGLDESSTRMIPSLATVVVARGATTGRFCLFGRSIAMNQTCYALHSITNHPFWLNCAFSNAVGSLVNAAHGSVFDTITTSTLENCEILSSSDLLKNAFEGLVAPIFEQILANSEESRTLAQTRDLLLPKLMSGEIRLREAEKLVGQSA